jgi:exosome complex component RRP46
LLNAALLALVSAAIPMSMTYVSTIIAVSPSGELLQSPSANDLKTAKSTHVFSFSSKGHVLLNESDGSFDIPTWERAHDIAQSICLSGMDTAGLTRDGDVEMEGGLTAESLAQVLRDAVEDRIREDYSWKIAGA